MSLDDALTPLIHERTTPPAEATKDEIRTMARRIVTDPTYVENLRRRALEGKLPPAIEVYLLQIGGGGKPEAETVKQHKHEHAVRIQHVYADEPKPKKVLPASVVKTPDS